MPFTHFTFPGRIKGILRTLPRAYHWQAVHDWHKGRVLLPAAVARSWADQIEADLREAAALATELRAHARWQDTERELRRSGFLRVNEKTGQNKAGHWRR